MDRMDRILERLSERINEWEGASREAIEAETNFKSYDLRPDIFLEDWTV